MHNQHNTRATLFQTDDGASNDRIVLINTTGRDYPSADVVNVLSATGNDEIVLRDTLANVPAAYGGEDDDTVDVSGAAVEHLRLKVGLGINREHLGHVTFNTSKSADFRHFD